MVWQICSRHISYSASHFGDPLFQVFISTVWIWHIYNIRRHISSRHLSLLQRVRVCWTPTAGKPREHAHLARGCVSADKARGLRRGFPPGKSRLPPPRRNPHPSTPVTIKHSLQTLRHPIPNKSEICVSAPWKSRWAARHEIYGRGFQFL